MSNTFIAAVLLAAGAAFGQTAATRPTFEVASVKPTALSMEKIIAAARSGEMPRIGARVDGARAEYIYESLQQLIAEAYKVKANQITGPDWLGTLQFDIVAKIPGGASKDDVPQMLQALLEERFKLTVRREAKDENILALLPGKGGLKLQEAPPPVPIDPDTPLKTGERETDTAEGKVRTSASADGTIIMNRGEKGIVKEKIDMERQTIHVETSSSTMEELAELLTSIQALGGGKDRQQVVDMTGIKGHYQVSVDVSLAEILALAKAQGVDVPAALGGNRSPGVEASDPSGKAGSVFAIVESMGLKLEKRKAPVDHIIVVSVEKTPTEN